VHELERAALFRDLTRVAASTATRWGRRHRRGRVGATPLIEFVRRSGVVSDVCGEKLAEAHVTRALDAATSRLGLRCAFLNGGAEMAAPPYYAVFAEAPGVSEAALARLAVEVDRGLHESPSYAYCRRLGQLGAMRAVVCTTGRRHLRRRCARLGQRAGDVKPGVLHATPGWSAHLNGVQGVLF